MNTLRNKLSTRSELQVTVAVILIVIVNAIAKRFGVGLDLGVEEILAMVTATGAYTVSRGMAKYEGLPGSETPPSRIPTDPEIAEPEGDED